MMLTQYFNHDAAPDSDPRSDAPSMGALSIGTQSTPTAFRCYLLRDGHIVLGEDLFADNLDGAVALSHSLPLKWPGDERFTGVEIWQGTALLYSQSIQQKCAGKAASGQVDLRNAGASDQAPVDRMGRDPDGAKQGSGQAVHLHRLARCIEPS